MATSGIARVETFVVRYPVVGQFKFLTSPTTAKPTRDTVVVRITDDSGQVGWGQCVPSPSWSYETTETVRTTIDNYLAPAILGSDPFDSDSLWKLMNRVIAPSFSTGQPLAKAGIDLAVWDLTGRLLNQSAGERWGRRGHDHVTLSWTVDVRQREDLEVSLAEAAKRGFRNFNLKVGSHPEWDVEVAAAVRRAAPNAFIWADANGGYDLETALAVAPRFADLGMAALEQPLASNRLPGYLKLRRQGALPILMDEPIVSLADLESFHQLGLLDGVAMKVSRCGGLTEARRIVEYLLQHGLLFFASGLTDPDLSLAASLQLYGVYGLPHPAALNAPQYLSGTILSEPIPIAGDQAKVPTGSGLGVSVDDGALLTLQ